MCHIHKWLQAQANKAKTLRSLSTKQYNDKQLLAMENTLQRGQEDSSSQFLLCDNPGLVLPVFQKEPQLQIFYM